MPEQKRALTYHRAPFGPRHPHGAVTTRPHSVLTQVQLPVPQRRWLWGFGGNRKALWEGLYCQPLFFCSPWEALVGEGGSAVFTSNRNARQEELRHQNALRESVGILNASLPVAQTCKGPRRGDFPKDKISRHGPSHAPLEKSELIHLHLLPGATAVDFAAPEQPSSYSRSNDSSSLPTLGPRALTSGGLRGQKRLCCGFTSLPLSRREKDYNVSLPLIIREFLFI